MAPAGSTAVFSPSTRRLAAVLLPRLRVSLHSTAPANPSFVPNAGSADHSGPFTYKVGSDGTLTVNAFDVSATVLSGPGAGANLVIDEIELSGLATADGKSLTLGSTEPVVQTLTFPNAAPVNRVCEYALVLTRLD